MRAFLALLWAGPAAAGGVQAIVGVTQTQQLTGASSPNRTDLVGVHGTDLGSMFLHDDGRIYLLFGDTFGFPGPPALSGDWRSNTMAFTSDTDASDGIALDGWITDVPGHAGALVPGQHDPPWVGEVTAIPTAGISIDGRQYMWLMSVLAWGAPGHWDVNHAEIATSDDDGRTWVLSGARWPADSNFIQTSFATCGDDVYVWGIPEGRFGSARLARVPAAAFGDPAAYTYWTGSGWSSGEETAADVLPSPVGEHSVVFNPYLRRWIATYLDESTASIELREARQPWGPFGPPRTLVSAATYPALYGAYMHPRYFEGDGQAFSFLMSQYGPYNVFVMRAVVAADPVPETVLTWLEEGGPTAVTPSTGDAYQVVLTQRPAGDVEVALQPTAGLVVDPATLEFTEADWSVPQEVRVSLGAAPPGPSLQAITHSVTSCDPYFAAESPADLAVHADGAPPPVLAAPTPGTAGVSNTWAVSGATPGALVGVVATVPGGSTAIGGCPGASLDGTGVRLVGTTTADASGAAAVHRSVPAAAAGTTWSFQVVEPGRCAVSAGVVSSFP